MKYFYDFILTLCQVSVCLIPEETLLWSTENER